MNAQRDLFTAGHYLKERGLDQVEESNVRWIDQMRKFARAHALTNERVTIDDVRGYANAIKFLPEHPGAYGAVFRGKEWQCIGREPTKVPTSHAREIKIWRLK